MFVQAVGMLVITVPSASVTPAVFVCYQMFASYAWCIDLRITCGSYYNSVFIVIGGRPGVNLKWGEE